MYLNLRKEGSLSYFEVFTLPKVLFFKLGGMEVPHVFALIMGGGRLPALEKISQNPFSISHTHHLTSITHIEFRSNIPFRRGLSQFYRRRPLETDSLSLELSKVPISRSRT